MSENIRNSKASRSSLGLLVWAISWNHGDGFHCPYHVNYTFHTSFLGHRIFNLRPYDSFDGISKVDIHNDLHEIIGVLDEHCCDENLVTISQLLGIQWTSIPRSCKIITRTRSQQSSLKNPMTSWNSLWIPTIMNNNNWIAVLLDYHITTSSSSRNS